MMRPSFRQIGVPLDEVSDDDLEELNEKLGVPALMTPSPRPAADAKASPSDAPKPTSRPSPTRAPSKRSTEQPQAIAASVEVRLAVNVPIYLRDAVNLRAAKERCTSRHIVMQGLQAIGFEIAEADMAADGRQLSPKR